MGPPKGGINERLCEPEPLRADFDGMTACLTCTPADRAGVRQGALSSVARASSSRCCAVSSRAIGTDRRSVRSGRCATSPRTCSTTTCGVFPFIATATVRRRQPVEASAARSPRVHQPVERRVGGSRPPAEPASDRGSPGGDGSADRGALRLARPVRARRTSASPGQARTGRELVRHRPRLHRAVAAPAADSCRRRRAGAARAALALPRARSLRQCLAPRVSSHPSG